MSIGLHGLPDDLVVRITKVLARRPEYGIATPSRRWLQRQDEKIRHLPKELLRPSGFRRLAIKIADRIDPNIVDPQAVLCKTHSTLNPFLIRRLFVALAYEVTVHTDALRSWQGRVSDPELSAFIGRLDSIVALWTAPKLFHEIYGLAPFDGHHVFVKSACEACCLAAVGASGRALADLRAALMDRMERRKGKGKEPRLYRIVEAWIDHLRKHSESGERSETCRALSESLLVDLRLARPHIRAWRAEQKKHHAELRAAQRPIYTELRRTRSGAKIAPLPPNAGHRRRTRHGIPVALVDTEGAGDQKRAAAFASRRDSIYRPDSLSGFSMVHERQKAAYDLPAGANPRPSAPEPVRASGPSDGSPTQSFLHRFEQDVSLEDECDPYEDSEERELDENNPADENQLLEESRARVQQWWANRVLSKAQLDPNQDDTKSTLSMVHPAFRPDASQVAASALPTPLHIKKDAEPRAANPRRRGQSTTSAWTDCTVYTVGPSVVDPSANIPPVPRIPSDYRRDGRDGDPSAVSRTPTDRTRGKPTAQDEQESTPPFPEGEGPSVNPENSAESTPSSSKKKSKKAPLNWPAPPHGKYYPPSTRDNPHVQKFFPSKTELGSTLSEQRLAFLAERFKPKGEGEGDSVATRRPGTPTPTPAAPNAPHPTSSVYSLSSCAPSLDSSHGSTPESGPESELRHGNQTPLQRAGPGVVPSSAASSWNEPVRPDDSISNAHRSPRRPQPQQQQPSATSSVTQLNYFQRKM
ncbi:hypothetical protein F5X98DRAFT_296426 [Xylaria grammica]|nr:hypothetical protein F5X98DRAFT_296426 [Xylaria grammica]